MNANLQRQVQQLGEARRRRQAAETAEQELARAVRSRMSEHGLTKVRSEEFEAVLVRQERLTVDPAKFRRAVSAKDFVSAVTVSVSTAREILGDRKLRRISSAAAQVQLRIAERSTRRAASSSPAGAEATADS